MLMKFARRSRALSPGRCDSVLVGVDGLLCEETCTHETEHDTDDKECIISRVANRCDCVVPYWRKEVYRSQQEDCSHQECKTSDTVSSSIVFHIHDLKSV